MEFTFVAHIFISTGNDNIGLLVEIFVPLTVEVYFIVIG